MRAKEYTHVINPHRFAASGIISALSGAPYRSGFDKNPLSFTYTRKIAHVVAGKTDTHIVHEIERNQLLISDITDAQAAMPALYPTSADRESIATYNTGKYICIAPSSVWFTKQFPAEKWTSLIQALPAHHTIYLIGAPTDKPLADTIIANAGTANAVNLCGKLNFLQSAALMQGAVMNYTNDSAPLHFASAMNAPLTALFCSTIPQFGFGPVRPQAQVVETTETLACRPCGLHGHKQCPEGHFKCALTITNNQLLWWTSKTT